MAEGYYVGGYASGHPVMTPVVDVVEVGAGGGSIAWIDDVGALKVGPQSSGAEPGPICYRRGGTEPTITDANVVLGRIGANDFLGGEMSLDLEAAKAGTLEKVGKPLNMTAEDGVARHHADRRSPRCRSRCAKSRSKKATIRAISCSSPRAARGPPHAVAIARELFIPTVIIPQFPAHFSALGMLMADERHDLVRTYLAELNAADFDTVRKIVEETARRSDQAARPHRERRPRRCCLDLRYVGQEFTLPVPVTPDQLDARATARGSAARSTNCTSSATPITPRTSRSRSSISVWSRSAIARSWRSPTSPRKASWRRAKPVRSVFDKGRPGGLSGL